MALGDFAASDMYEEPMQFQLMFDIFFLIFSLISLLIILNMVIAVMSATFERIDQEKEAYMLRERLDVIMDHWFRIPGSYKRKFRESKYLVIVDVDPQVDFIEQENEEKRIRQDIGKVNMQINTIENELEKTNHNIDELSKRFNKFEELGDKLSKHFDLK